MSEIPYFEFSDPDDPESGAYPHAAKKTSFKITIEPQLYLLVMIEKDHAKLLPPDALTAVRQLMEASYEQGKRVGAMTTGNS